MSSSDVDPNPSDSDEEIGWVYYNSEDSEDEMTPSNAWYTPNLLSTIVTYDEATHEAWIQAKYEISIARENIKRVLSLQRLSNYKLEKMITLLLGKIWNKVNTVPHIASESVNLFMQNIVTFYVISSFGISTTDFFNNDMIDKKECSTQSEYI